LAFYKFISLEDNILILELYLTILKPRMWVLFCEDQEQIYFSVTFAESSKFEI